MKLVTYTRTDDPGQARSGIWSAGLVHDALDGLSRFRSELGTVPDADYSSLLGVLRGGPAALEALRKLQAVIELRRPGPGEGATPESEVRLLAPLPRPNSIRDFLVFEEHLVNAMQTVARWRFPPAGILNSVLRRRLGVSLLRPPRAWYRAPVYYKGNPDSVVGPGVPIEWPWYTERLDYELEFGLYVLKPGRDIPEQEAGSYIAGYTIFNDFSARDVQLEEMSARLGPAKGKDFDTGNVMGPWLVTPDEVGDPGSLQMEAWVNGERWSAGSSRGMHFSFPEIIAYVSRSETLRPGDFLGSGTVGAGCGLELDRWLRPGDVVTLKVEKLGELTNPVIRSPRPAA